LEDPVVADDYFPLKVYGIYDRITLEEQRIPRLKEDIIKILGESKKFGVRISENDTVGTGLALSEEDPTDGTNVELTGNSNIEISKKKTKKKTSNGLPLGGEGARRADGVSEGSQSIQRFTDKMFCPNCNITYPEFTTQHFSPNRQE
jgi:excinuclease UvrABC ATPase subunit